MRRPAAMAIVVALLLVSFVVAPVAAAGQDTAQDDPAPTATATAEGGTELGEDTESFSNTGVLLFGSVLLAGGIWAYQNREKRGYRY